MRRACDGAVMGFRVLPSGSVCYLGDEAARRKIVRLKPAQNIDAGRRLPDESGLPDEVVAIIKGWRCRQGRPIAWLAVGVKYVNLSLIHI